MSDWETWNPEDGNFKAWARGGGRVGGGYGGGGGGGSVSTAAPILGNYSSPLSNQGGGQLQRRRADMFTSGYSGAADAVNAAAGPLNYHADVNDPFLAALRTRAAGQQRDRRMRAGDEFARAGMLGSSQFTSGMDDMNRGFGEEMSAIDNNVFGQQRADQLGLYRDDLGFRRDMAGRELDAAERMKLAELQRRWQQEDSRSALWGELMGAAGGFAGDLGYGYLSNKLGWLK